MIFYPIHICIYSFTLVVELKFQTKRDGQRGKINTKKVIFLGQDRIR